MQEGVGIKQGIVMGSDGEMGKIPRFTPVGIHQPFPAKAYAIENKRLIPSGFRKHKVNRINNICILCH